MLAFRYQFFHKISKHFFSSSSFKKYDIDIHKGLHLDPEDLPTNIAEFNLLLKNSLKQWQEQNLTGIWIKLPINKLFLLEPALSFSFKLHHCSEDYIMLTKWIKPNIENKIPSYCTHYVGCGGTIISHIF